MSFISPLGLILVLAVPLLLGIYLLGLRRRRRRAVTYPSLGLLRAVMPRRAPWKRHLPVAALLVGLALLGVAAGRPQIESNVPVGKTVIILALDESASMCDTDVTPNRLAAAQKAALAFVAAQPSGVRTGLVLFSDLAELVVAPTRDHRGLDRAIDNLNAGDGTALGAAILKGLDAIAQVDSQVEPVGAALAQAATLPSSGSGSPTTVGRTVKPGRAGYVPDVIVVMTDGANDEGISPVAAAQYAAAQRVRVYTVGLGTTRPATLACSPSQLGDQAGLIGNGPGHAEATPTGPVGPNSPLVVDLGALRDVSRLTGGASYTAKSASQLDRVFTELPKEVASKKAHHELTWIFALAGGLVALLALGAAVRWSPGP